MYMGAVDGNWEWSFGGKEGERLKNIEKMVGADGSMFYSWLALARRTLIESVAGTKFGAATKSFF